MARFILLLTAEAAFMIPKADTPGAVTDAEVLVVVEAVSTATAAKDD